jgi:predicted DNA-binding transcriptional regulator AlpA
MEAKMETLDPGTTGQSRPGAPKRGRKLVPTKRVAERYDSSTRTIERWTDDPTLNFPKPIYIKRRRFWREDELDDFDAAQAEGTQ